MEDIAARAGVSKGSVYRYFPDKNQLFRESVTGTWIRLFNAFLAHQIRQPEDYLLAAWRLLNDPGFRAVYLLTAATLTQFEGLGDQLRTGIEQTLVKPFATILGQIERDDPITSDAADERAGFTIALLLGLALEGRTTAEPASRAIAFALRACELDPATPQADGF